MPYIKMILRQVKRDCRQNKHCDETCPIRPFCMLGDSSPNFWKDEQIAKSAEYLEGIMKELMVERNALIKKRLATVKAKKKAKEAELRAEKRK